VQLLRICRYYPMIQERILDLIISKCLEIDVEIVIEDSGEVKIEEENHGDINDVVFSTDNDPSSSNQVSQRVYNEGSQFIPTEVAEMADKLDTVLCLLIDFIRKEIEIQDVVDSDGLPLSTASINTNNNNNNEKNKNNNNYNSNNKNNVNNTNNNNNNNNIINNNDNNTNNKNQIQNEKAERLSTQLMRIFEEKILMTHRSKFVQFVLFYFASRVPSFGSKFGSRLVKLFSDESAAHTKRQSAILYLASYSVRANFLNISTIRYVSNTKIFTEFI
jgi:RNA polymerase I specific transcription initiation factor RRN3